MTEVSCTYSLMSDISTTQTALILKQAPFTLDVEVVPGIEENQMDIYIHPSIKLNDNPNVQITQIGTPTSSNVSMEYFSEIKFYKGTVELDENFPLQGTIEIYATEGAQSILIINSFNLSSVFSDQDQMISSYDNNAYLYLPIGSISVDGIMNLALDTSEKIKPEELDYVSGPYVISSNKDLTFIDNANLKFRYVDIGGTLSKVDLTTLSIYQWDDITDKWIRLKSNINEDHLQVSTLISSVGTYAAMAEYQSKIYLPVIIMR
jgi:hypothetical protein